MILKEDNFEDSLAQSLIARGVKKEDISTNLKPILAS
jgi:hypothetical protein